MRMASLLMALLFTAAQNSGFASDATDAAKAQAEEISQAVVRGDYKKLADLTHPKIVTQIGGKEQLMEVSEKAVQSMKTLGVEMKGIKVGDPVEPVESNKELYTVIPFTLSLSKTGEAIEKESFYIAVSSNGGKKWTFVDGGQLGTDNVKQILPDFPSGLKLPVIKKK
jgi:hypothetical protein